MSDQSKQTDSTDPRVQAALREYLERVDRGEVVNRDEFLARHLEIADALRSFFAAEEPLRKIEETRISEESAGTSTQSIAAQGQETVAPQAQPDGSRGTKGSGLAGQFGRYQILRALGKGAMGAVYLAQDTQLKRHVAIKTPHLDEDPTGELLKRFYREAEAAATLRHANICPIHDVGEIDGKHFISMAYIEGRPLSDLIRGGKTQNERKILIAVHKLAQGLQHAHDRGIVHRDLKPANVMVDKQGEPIIMDFGLARKRRTDGEASLTHSGVILGSPAYMSPEQIEGDPENVGPASDQYSLGVVLYEMLTGQLPFRGSIANVLAQIIAKGPAPPSALHPGLDPRIEAVCLRMMAKTASDRFPSMKAVADHLAAIVKNPVSASSNTAPETGEDSPTASQVLAAPGPSPGDAGASQIGQSLNQKSISPSNVSSIEELVRKCLRRGDYNQVIEIIERIPEDRRNDSLRALLEEASEKVDAISLLICEIDEADRANDGKTALKKAEELLKLKPGHHRAQEIQQKYSGDGNRAAARKGPLSQFTRPWNAGGWIPWSALALGLAVLVGMSGVVVVYLGKTAIVVDIKDPGVEVAVKGTTLTVTGPDKQSFKVEPGQQALTITGAGLEATTRNFSLKKGDKKTVTVSIVDKEIVARLEKELLPAPPARDQPSSRPIARLKEPRTPPPNTREKPPETAPPRMFKNSLGMEFVFVPKGTSWLGGGDDRPGNKKLTITDDFYLGRYEVTQQEWEKVMGLKPSYFSRGGDGKEQVKNIPEEQLGRFPVETVSWEDAQLFLERLNTRDREAGWVYRLPREAEWEYACRGGPLADVTESAFDFYFDKPTNQLSPEQANFGSRPNGQTCKVGSYPPNRLGLYDMHGNVFEWCDDAEKGPGGASLRVTRGGCWVSPYGRGGSRPWACVASYRWARPASTRDKRLGLRVARTPVDKELVEISPSESSGTPSSRGTAPSATVDATGVGSTASGTTSFVPLFNGKDLTGWTTHSSQPRGWQVEDGVLVGRGPERWGFLYSVRDDFTDFHLRAEVRVNVHGNSGIYFRSGFGPSNVSRAFGRCPAGYEADIFGQETGSLFTPKDGVLVPVRKSLIRGGKWFTLDVIAEGNHIAVRVNGVTTVDFVDEKRRFTKGRIALQRWLNARGMPATVEFRKIEIQELTPPIASAAAPASTSSAADRQAAEALLGVGAAVAVRVDGQEKWVQSSRDLPTAPCELIHVRLNQTANLTDASLEPLESVSHLLTAEIFRCRNVGDAGLAHLRNQAQLQKLVLEGTGVTDDGLAVVERLPHLEVLGLGNTTITDAALAHVEHLTNLHALWLGQGPRITDEGLAHLQHLTGLRELNLWGAPIDGPGLKYLEGLKDLERLALGGTHVDDLALAHLTGHQQLRQLFLGKTRVTDDGLVNLEPLTALRNLALDFTGVSNSGLAHLKPLAQLRTLNLRKTRVSDAGLAQLTGLTNLANLNLHGNRITDAGLEMLKDMRPLTELNVTRTRVTGGGVAKLQTSLPHCRIIANPRIP